MDFKSKDGTVLKYEEGKPCWSVMPYDALVPVVRVFEFGARKYGRPGTYRAGIPYSKLFDSAMRHLLAWYYGEDNDPDSGVHHLAHCVANCLMLLTIKSLPNFDDRTDGEA